MPTWLTAAKVLPLAGYPDTHAQANAALDAAEDLISWYTGLLWGAQSIGENVRVQLTAKSEFIELGKDVTAVTATTPLESGFTTERFGTLLRLIDSDDNPIVWASGWYKLTVTRGILTIGEDVQKAASLLVGWYLSLSDEDRSRYRFIGQGDFSGSMILQGLPVPEAEQLLSRYSKGYDVALV